MVQWFLEANPVATSNPNKGQQRMLEPKHCMTLNVITFMLYHQVVKVIKLLLQGWK
jgi:hypothetical protein